MKVLPIANTILPLTPVEETFYFILKLGILGIGFFSIVLVSRDVLSHFKFKQDQYE